MAHEVPRLLPHLEKACAFLFSAGENGKRLSSPVMQSLWIRDFTMEAKKKLGLVADWTKVHESKICVAVMLVYSGVTLNNAVVNSGVTLKDVVEIWKHNSEIEKRKLELEKRVKVLEEVHKRKKKDELHKRKMKSIRTKEDEFYKRKMNLMYATEAYNKDCYAANQETCAIQAEQVHIEMERRAINEEIARDEKEVLLEDELDALAERNEILQTRIDAINERVEASHREADTLDKRREAIEKEGALLNGQEATFLYRFSHLNY